MVEDQAKAQRRKDDLKECHGHPLDCLVEVRQIEAARDLGDELLLQLKGATHGLFPIVAETAAGLLAGPESFAITRVL